MYYATCLLLAYSSVAMSAPDIGLIAEVILYSEGLRHAKEVRLSSSRLGAVISHDVLC